MNRLVATKSDLADIITSGGGTFSSNSNELLTSSYANSLNSDTIGGTLTLTYSIDSTGRSSYLSNECVLYEDIHFTKNSEEDEGSYVLRINPYDFTIDTESWVYFTVESYYIKDGVKTKEPCYLETSIPDWFTVESYSQNDETYAYGWRVKANSDTESTREYTVYFRQSSGTGRDYIKVTQTGTSTPSGPAYVISIQPWQFTITTDSWTYFTVQSYSTENDVYTPESVSVQTDSIPEWCTVERDSSSDEGAYFGYRVKANSETDTTRSQQIYFEQDVSGETDYIKVIQEGADGPEPTTTYTITYKASTGVSGSDVTEEVEEGTIYTPSAPSSFTLMSGYTTPFICDPSSSFTVTENKTIYVSATKEGESEKPKNYEFIWCQTDVDYDPDTGGFQSFGTEIDTDINTDISNKTGDQCVGFSIKSVCIQEGSDDTYPDYTVVNESEIPSWLDIEFTTVCNLPYNEIININAKTSNSGNERSFTLKLEQDDSGNIITITITQVDGNVVFISNFDNMFVNYNWTDDDGKDLDSATRIGYLTYGGIVTWGDFVGFNQDGNSSEAYLTYSGDNRTSGDEGTAIDFAGYLDSIPQSIKNDIRYVVIEARANWYEQIGNALAEMSYHAYKGGTITQNGFTFSNTSGKLVVEDVATVPVMSFGDYLSYDADRWYTQVLYILYDPISANASCQFGYDSLENQGWSGTVYMRVKNNDSDYVSDWVSTDTPTSNTLGFYKTIDAEDNIKVGDSVTFQYYAVNRNGNYYYRGQNLELDIYNGDDDVISESTEDGHYVVNVTFTVKNRSYSTSSSVGYDVRMLSGLAPMTCYLNVGFNVEAETQDSELKIVGIYTDYNEDKFENSSLFLSASSFLFGSWDYCSAPTDPHDIVLNVKSIDSSGNASPITVSDNGGTTTSITDYSGTLDYNYVLTITLPDMTEEDGPQLYELTIKNDAGLTKTKTFGQRPAWCFCFDSVKPSYMKWGTGILEYSADSYFKGEIVRYILALENDVETLENFVIESQDDYDWISCTLDKDNGTLTFTYDENTVSNSRSASFDVYQVGGPSETNKRTITITQPAKS